MLNDALNCYDNQEMQELFYSVETNQTNEIPLQQFKPESPDDILQDYKNNKSNKLSIIETLKNLRTAAMSIINWIDNFHAQDKELQDTIKDVNMKFAEIVKIQHSFKLELDRLNTIKDYWNEEYSFYLNKIDELHNTMRNMIDSDVHPESKLQEYEKLYQKSRQIITKKKENDIKINEVSTIHERIFNFRNILENKKESNDKMLCDLKEGPVEKNESYIKMVSDFGTHVLNYLSLNKLKIAIKLDKSEIESYNEIVKLDPQKISKTETKNNIDNFKQNTPNKIKKTKIDTINLYNQIENMKTDDFVESKFIISNDLKNNDKTKSNYNKEAINQSIDVVKSTPTKEIKNDSNANIESKNKKIVKNEPIDNQSNESNNEKRKRKTLYAKNEESNTYLIPETKKTIVKSESDNINSTKDSNFSICDIVQECEKEIIKESNKESQEFKINPQNNIEKPNLNDKNKNEENISNSVQKDELCFDYKPVKKQKSNWLKSNTFDLVMSDKTEEDSYRFKWFKHKVQCYQKYLVMTNDKQYSSKDCKKVKKELAELYDVYEQLKILRNNKDLNSALSKYIKVLREYCDRMSLFIPTKIMDFKQEKGEQYCLIEWALFENEEENKSWELLRDIPDWFKEDNKDLLKNFGIY